MKRVLPNKKFGYCYLFVIFTLTFYGAWYWPPMLMLPYLGILIGLLLPVVNTPSIFSQKQFLFLIFYIIIVFFNFLSGDTFFKNFKLVLQEIVALFIPMSIFFYFFLTKDVKWVRVIVRTTIVILAWITIATAIFDAILPGIVRYVQVQKQEQISDGTMFMGLFRWGLSDYILPHALPVLIPVSILAIRDNKMYFIDKCFYIILLICVVLLLYYGGATGPLLVGLLVLVLSILARPGHVFVFAIELFLLCLVIMPLLFNDQFMLDFLNWLDGLLGYEGSFHKKVLTFQENIIYSGSQGSVNVRQSLYQKGIDAFFDNIIWGAQGDVGGHSALLNRLASLGLIGFIPYVGFIIAQIKFTVLQIPYRNRLYFYIGLFGALLMFTTKGIADWDLFYFTFSFLPLAIIYLSSSSSK